MKYIASCSCGKDSLAMVYRLIEENYPLDEIVFYDTGMEFESIYNNWNELSKYAESKNIKCVTLKPQNPFLYTMFEQPHKCRKLVKLNTAITGAVAIVVGEQAKKREP